MNGQGNNANLIVAILLSVLVLVGFQYFYENPRIEAARAQKTAAQAAAQVLPPSATNVPGVDATKIDAPLRPRTEILQTTAAERVTISTSRLHGSINLRGGRIDDLTLADYKDTVEDNAAEVVLLSPTGTAAPGHAYFAEFGWLASDTAQKMPSNDTLWKADRRQLTVAQPVTLTWDNGQGLVFERTIAVDENFMFTVTDRVRSTTASATMYNFGVISRHTVPPTTDLFILHEGPLGVFDETLTEAKYHDLTDDGALEKSTKAGGWAGITDKYWLVALAPDQTLPMTARMLAVSKPQQGGGRTDEKFQVDVRSAGLPLQAGGAVQATTHLFAGAKEVRLLDAYEEQLKIVNFDLAVDFGWFYFLTKPFFYALDGIARFFAASGYGFAIAILLFTVLLKLVFFPLQNKSFKAMNRMKDLTPKMMELRDRYKDDRQKLNMEMFELYRREKVNPMAGCWPVLIQIPVFFALYKVLYVSIEMRHAPFWGWVPDLAAPDPTSLFNLFGLLPYDVPNFLMIGIWPILMGLTMYGQQRMAPTSPDPTQAMIFKWLPVVFTFMLAHFPAGLVIYWTWSNLLSIAQQWAIRRTSR